MSSNMTVDSPPVADAWATAGDRRDAARQAYRQSVAVGRPLNGVRLGTMFDRSPRWGVDRIAEVRSEDISRSSGSHADDAGSELGSNGNSPAATAGTNGDVPLPIGNSGNGTHPETGSGPHSSRRNGNRAAESAVPIRSADNGAELPIGNNGNGTRLPLGSASSGIHPHEPVNAPPCQEPRPERGSRSFLDTAITLVVAAVAAAASYGHMLHVALMAGEPMWIARAFPITVDGLVLAALRRGEEGRGWLALGAAVSIAANVLAQFPELAATAGPVVSAWPPLALYGTHRLLAGRHDSRLGDAEGTER